MKKAKITLNILAVISFIFGALYCFSLVFIPIGVYCFAAGRLFAYKADHMMDSYSADKKTLSRYFVFVAIVCFPLGLISGLAYLFLYGNNVKVEEFNYVKITDVAPEEKQEEPQTEEVKEEQPKVETPKVAAPIKEIIEEVKEEVVEIIEEIKEEVAEVVEEIKEEIEEIKEEIKEEIEEIKEEIEERKEENEKLEEFNNTPVSELIDESLRITPREKKEPKQTKKANTNDNMQSLDF